MRRRSSVYREVGKEREASEVVRARSMNLERGESARGMGRKMSEEFLVVVSARGGQGEKMRMAPVLEGCELAQNRLKNPFR
ncbi:hypothetical protein COLO4_10179 [Corchorus olitorius]|uniref:Uncharacterized protein n=1 Tax=Corchorus olitorius TaxID=93759 RepID=A0A1R3K9X8_9ROSI|nr:hypothetical protein COLO4_10179 [Corchorus olitorius]